MIFFITQIIIIIYITLKAICELVRNNLDTNKGKAVYDSFTHSNQHMVYLMAIILYQVVNLGTYIMFYSHADWMHEEHSILWLKMTLLNVIWLLVINHFQQERLGITKIPTLKEILKL